MLNFLEVDTYLISACVMSLALLTLLWFTVHQFMSDRCCIHVYLKTVILYVYTFCVCVFGFIFSYIYIYTVFIVTIYLICLYINNIFIFTYIYINNINNINVFVYVYFSIHFFSLGFMPKFRGRISTFASRSWVASASTGGWERVQCRTRGVNAGVVEVGRLGRFGVGRWGDTLDFRSQAESMT